jgi:hypothetical protein
MAQLAPLSAATTALGTAIGGPAGGALGAITGSLISSIVGGTSAADQERAQRIAEIAQSVQQGNNAAAINLYDIANRISSDNPAITVSYANQAIAQLAIQGISIGPNGITSGGINVYNVGGQVFNAGLPGAPVNTAATGITVAPVPTNIVPTSAAAVQAIQQGNPNDTQAPGYSAAAAVVADTTQASSGLSAPILFGIGAIGVALLIALVA